MKERAVVFGSGSRLVGVMTDPADGASRDPAFVFLNAGVVHRIGPNRLYVRIARALAEHGYTSLRFDLSGLGDSAVRSDALSVTESAVLEAREAMDYLTRARGSRRFVTVGICSGATIAFGAALADGRVDGIAAIDAYVFPTLRFHVLSYLRYYAQLLRPDPWRNMFEGVNRAGRVLYRLLGRVPRRVADPLPDLVQTQPPSRNPASRDRAAAALRELVDRGTHLFLAFSGGQNVMNYVGQVADAFPEVRFGRQLTVRYFAESDHTFPRQPHQRRVINAVLNWVASTFDQPVRPAGQNVSSEVTGPIQTVRFGGQ